MPRANKIGRAIGTRWPPPPGDTRQAVAPLRGGACPSGAVSPNCRTAGGETSEKTRWIEGPCARASRGSGRRAYSRRAAPPRSSASSRPRVADAAAAREGDGGQLMLALYRAGRQGEALGAYQRGAGAASPMNWGVDPGPELRRLEARDRSAGTPRWKTPVRTTASVDDSRRDLPADRHRGVDGGRGRRTPTARWRWRSHDTTSSSNRVVTSTRRTADQDARRGRCHVLGLRAAVGGRGRRHRAAGSDRR